MKYVYPQAKTPLPTEGAEAELYQELLEFIRSMPRKESSLIAVLHKAQNLFSYIPETAQKLIAEMLDLPSSKVYGVVTFYSFFTEEPRGKYLISACLGTTCYVNGSSAIIDALEETLGISCGQTTPDGLFTLIAARCLGNCAHSPNVMVNGEIWSEVTPEKVGEIIAHYREMAQREEPVYAENNQ